MADDPATFQERFTGQADPVIQREGGLLQTVPKAFELGSQIFTGLAKEPGNFVQGLLDFFKAPGKAFNEGLSPEEEISFGLNGALATIGGAKIFNPTDAVVQPFKAFHEQVTRPAAQRIIIPLDERNVASVRGSDVPASVPRSQLALTGEPHVDAVLQSPVTRGVIDNPVVDRTHDVPYTAGGSVPLADEKMFIDKNFPRAFNIDGKVFDPADPFAVHENVEQHTMDILTKGGMTDEEAYRVAHFEFAEKAEGAWYRAHGIDQEKAEAAYAPYMAAIQHDQGTDFPPNLYKRPYPHDMPSAAKTEAIAEPRPSPDEIDRAKQIIADWQAKGGPSPEPAAPKPTVNPLAEAHDLGVIGPDKSVPIEEPPARAAQRAIPAAQRFDPNDKITMTPAGEPIDAWEARFKQWVQDLKSPEEVKPLIEESAAKNNNFPEARAGYVNPAHIEALAESAGVDPTTIEPKKLTAFFNTPDKIRMAKQLLDTTLDNFRAAAAKVATDGSEQNIAKMLEAEIKRDYALEQVLGLRAEWGRSGHALRDLLEKVEGENRVNDLLKSKGRTPKDMQDLARGIADLDNSSAARVLSNMRGQQPHWFYWMWVQGLISGPFTHAKYFLANALYAATERGVVTPMAAVLGRLRTGPDKVFGGEGPMMAWGTIKAIPDAIRSAYETVKTGVRVPLESESELAARAEAAGERVPSSVARAVNPVTQMGRPIPGVWGRVIGAPGDMASAIHTVFKVLGERANLEAWAYNKTASEGLSPSDQAFWDRYSFHSANPTEQVLKDSVYQAYKETFMQELGPKAAAFQRTMKQSPFLRWLIPFAHIPINLMKATYEYTPFAFLDGDMRANLTGKNGGRAQDMAIARMVVGSSVMGYFVNKYMAGQATGAYPRDPKERSEWKMMGKIPNSVQIGDRWVSFERFGPAGGLAAIGADIGSLIAHSDKEDAENWTKLTWLAANAAANVMADAPGFQSVRNIFEALTEYQQGARFASWEAGSLLPFSSLVTQTASFVDPQMRAARTFLDGLLYRMPGMREDLAPKRDPLYGEPVANPGYMNIIRKAPVEQDFAKSELTRIGYYPHAPQHEIGGVKLTPEQYDKYQATAGPLVKQALDRLVRSPRWSEQPPQWQIQAAKSTISYARKIAAQAMQIDDPSLILAGRARRLGQINAH